MFIKIITANNYTESYSLNTDRKCVVIIMLDNILLILVIIGAVNWGSIGFFNYDIVTNLFGGAGSAFPRIIFALVGLAGIYTITLLFKEKHFIGSEKI